MLPLNVSLDLGSTCGAQRDLAIIDTDYLRVTCYNRSQGPTTLGHEMPWLVEESQVGERERDRVMGSQQEAEDEWRFRKTKLESLVPTTTS